MRTTPNTPLAGRLRRWPVLFLLALLLPVTACDSGSDDDGDEGATLSGRVTVTGVNAFAGARVAAYASLADLDADEFVASATTGADGRYSLEVDEAGPYYVDVIVDVDGDDEGDLYDDNGRAAVTLNAGANTKNFTLNAGGGGGAALSGRVTRDGAPVAGIRVAVYASLEDLQADDFLASTQTDAQGRYALEGEPGSYYFEAWLDADNSGTINAGDTYGLSGGLDNPAPVAISAGENTLDLPAVLVGGGSGGGSAGTLTGQVARASSGAAVSGARVAVYRTIAEFNADTPAFQTTSGANGSYTLADLPAGAYYLDALVDADNSGGWSSTDPYGYYGIENGAPAQVQVAAGQTASANLLMVFPGGRTAGGASKLAVK